MKRLLNYLPLHFVVLGVFGICLQFFTCFWYFNFGETILLLGFLTLLILFVKNNIFRTFTSLILFFFIGVSSVYINDDRNYESFYKHHLKENSLVVLQIHKVLKSGNYHQKYEAKVLNVDDEKTTGTILLNIKKDTVFKVLNVDAKLLLKPVLSELTLPLNPHQFNYKSYLAKQGIHHQIFIENSQFLTLNSKERTLFGWSAKFRNQVQKSLKKHNFKADELAVINALLLGQRQDISKELITDYQRAGAIHILAVSGLHIGVLMLILSFLLKPIESIKYGRFLKMLLIVFLLWMFAFIAGLSASVVRAVTMFTFLAFGLSFKRKNVVEFSFISSMFFLLLIQPMFLFDVGFQLSYLAVFGILWIQPKLYKLYTPRFLIDKKIWELFSVSIAAQIGIFPLSIYYFHQFPGLFLASNLVIIPFLGAILIGGVFVIITSLLNILPQFLANFYGTIISWMNGFVSWVSHQEKFLFKEISISFNFMICCYVFTFLGILFLMNVSAKKMIYFLISIVLIQGVFLLESNEKQSKKEIIIFHKSSHTLIGNRIGKQLFLQHSLDSLQFKNENSIKSYKIIEGVNEVHQTKFKNLIKCSKKEILLVDSLGVYAVSGLVNPIVVLQYSPKINVSRLIQKIKPSQIIADGSNYKSDIIRWESICFQNKIPFYYTGIKGAFILKY
ncbi:ComEC/Rec2 family competence protein [uncultured Polaribacter sp.]|uniref:ComEC/Rec2 family competence protein n=1 Tax=uncultured Polaribacter sp. TaxID=174711 RepID=UPI00262DF784|nr:ComEC/Rec2 family competence protein [uncultured Polaribacter sp.]